MALCFEYLLTRAGIVTPRAEVRKADSNNSILFRHRLRSNPCVQDLVSASVDSYAS
jgi:hypothetical protein